MKAWYERWILNPKAISIAKSMRDEPESWKIEPEYNEYAYTHYTLYKDGLEIWLANGHWFIDIYKPVSEKLGVVGRYLVYFSSRKPLKLALARVPKKNKNFEIINKWENK